MRFTWPFVSDRQKWIEWLERLSRTLCYILPGRFEDAELVSEAIYALTNLVKSMTLAQLTSDGIDFSRLSLAQTYLLHSLKDKSDAKLLTVSQALLWMKQCQILLEMIVYRNLGPSQRLSFLITYEALKLTLKLCIWHLQGQRMNIVPVQAATFCFPMADQPTHPDNTAYCGPRMSYTYDVLKALQMSDKEDSAAGLESYVTRKALGKSSHDPVTTWSRVTRKEHVFELMYLARPLVYLLALRQCGPQSWKPWILSIVIEYGSYKFYSQRVNANAPAKQEDAFDLLRKKEIHRRGLELVYYLLREPFYSIFVKQAMNGWVNALSNNFLLGSSIGSKSDSIVVHDEHVFAS